MRRSLALALVAALVGAAPAHAAHGALDPNFGGGDGVALVNFPDLSGESATGVVRQSDGRLVTGGTALDASGFDNFVLARLSFSGNLDTSFGNGGRRFVRFSASDMLLTGLVRLPGDGLLAVGTTTASGVNRFALARFTANGSADSSFGSGGLQRVSFAPDGANATAEDVAVQSDGKLVVVGRYIPPGGRGSFAVARLNPDGRTLDTSFGSGGRVITQVTSSTTDSEGAVAVIVQADGKIVVLGFAGSQLAVVRYTAGGTPDPTFGSGGRFTQGLIPNQAEQPADIVRRSDGKYVVTGETFRDRFLVLRLNANGTVDTGFASNGTALISFGADTGVFSNAMLHGSDGDVLVAGGVFPATFSLGAETSQFALARVNSDGSLDTLFGGDGRVVTNLAGDSEEIRDLTPQPDGFLVAGGASHRKVQDGIVTRFDTSIAVARYHGIRDEQAPRCRYRVRRKGLHRVRIRVRCNEAARVRLRVKLPGRKRVSRRLRFKRPRAKTTTVRSPESLAGKRMRARAVARDAANNVSRRTLRRRLR